MVVMMDQEKLLLNVERLYKEITEDDKRLSKDFLSVSLETIEKLCNSSFSRHVYRQAGKWESRRKN